MKVPIDIFFPLVLVIVGAIDATITVLGQNVTTDTSCSDEMTTFCETESNRFCYVSTDTGEETCGNCLSGYVNWRTRCINQDNVDIALFLEEYKPQYVSSLSNEERAQLLIKTIQFIAVYQSQNPPLPFELGINAFSADSDEDYKTLQGFNPETISEEEAETVTESAPVTFQALPFEPNAELPSKVDWVQEGKVTSVKDQGRCGCCWAVSLVGSLEGAAAIQNNFLQSLSFQQFISCDNRNLGCDGGSLVYAMAYPIFDTDGIANANDYLFTDSKGDTTGHCDTTIPTAIGVSKASYVIDYYDLLNFDERVQRMKAALAKQPVSMVLRSNCKLFSNYKSGILTTDDGCECNEPTCADHAVLMVGYDDTSSPPSWKLKNSWGTGWGENGYFRIAQTQTENNFGLFGVLTHGIVPDLTYNVTNGTVSDSRGPNDDDDSGNDSDIKWWAWLLVVLASICVVSLVCSVGTAFLCPRKRQEE